MWHDGFANMVFLFKKRAMTLIPNHPGSAGIKIRAGENNRI
jgi:hypothetical protein